MRGQKDLKPMKKGVNWKWLIGGGGRENQGPSYMGEIN